jgi:hypothetical protein
VALMICLLIFLPRSQQTYFSGLRLYVPDAALLIIISTGFALAWLPIRTVVLTRSWRLRHTASSQSDGVMPTR